MLRGHHSLRGFNLFESLKEEEVDHLDKRSSWRHFEAGTRILDYNDRSSEIYFVARGVVRIWLPTSRRTDLILSDVGPGAFFGELAAIDGRPRLANVTALTATTLAGLPADALHTTMLQHPSVAAQLLQHFARRIRVASVRVWEFSRLSVRDRVRAELLRLAQAKAGEPNSASISPPPTHTELAARISAHREAVTRECKALERIGLLERRRGALVLPNVTALADLLERPQRRAGYADRSWLQDVPSGV